ncbi:hypothetical protein ADUPG1_006044, partial [Aduncisulcus paluster]
SYVLVRPKKKPPKLHPRWAGPVEVVKLFKDRNSLEVKWLSGKEENEVISLRRIVKFRSQDYSLEDLKKLAQLDDEAYVVEEIRGHRMGDDGLELLIKWLGYEEVFWEPKDGLKTVPLVMEYCQEKEENEVISLRRIVKFRSQDYSLEDLKKLAQLDDEAYVVEEIRGHRMGDDGLELLIKWLGYEEVFWEPKDGLKTVPLVMEYCQEKELE